MEMIGWEKVIKGLECCRNGFCFACPYNDGIDESTDCKQRWADDALALLKAQEPRVMTLEEALGGDECWIEGRSGACGYGDALLTDDGERVDFYRPHSINTLDLYEYGLSWRCWTSRPDEKRRAETPWE